MTKFLYEFIDVFVCKMNFDSIETENRQKLSHVSKDNDGLVKITKFIIYMYQYIDR